MADRGPIPKIPDVERWADNPASGTMADVAMDAADWYYPTSIDAEADMGGRLRINQPAGRGGTLHPAPLAEMGQAGDMGEGTPGDKGQ